IKERICCCSVTRASLITAVISVVIWGAVTVLGWLWSPAPPIYLSILVTFQFISALLVFVAYFKRKAVLVMPIIAVQVLTSGTLIGYTVNYFVNEFGYATGWNRLYMSFALFGTTLVSSFMVDCHVSCYKKLRSEERQNGRGYLLSHT
ncbi:hypothetical protein PFISCL1PPCAC_13105, partial [Pristionchus fissidentatus]